MRSNLLILSLFTSLTCFAQLGAPALAGGGGSSGSGAGAGNLWKLQGNRITQLDTSHSILIQDSFMISNGTMEAYFYPNEIGWYIYGETDTTLFTQTDTSFLITVISDNGNRSSMICEKNEVIVNKYLANRNYTYTFGIDSTRFYWDKDYDIGSDTVAAQLDMRTLEQTYASLAGIGTRYVTASSTGTLNATTAAPDEIYFSNTVPIDLPNNTSPNTIYIDTIPANYIDSGDIVEITVWGTFAANNHERVVTISFNSGASALPFTGSTTINNMQWKMQCVFTPRQDDLTAVASSTIFMAGNGDLNTTPVYGVNTDPQSFDFTQDNIIEIIGQTDTGGATGDIQFIGIIITIQR